MSNVLEAAKKGDLETLQTNKHLISEHVNEITQSLERHEQENYITYWIASYAADKQLALEMYKIFTDSYTIVTAGSSANYENGMHFCARAAIFGAIASENVELLELIKEYIIEFGLVYEEIKKTNSEILLQWFEENFVSM
jgi:hypothetical protein